MDDSEHVQGLNEILKRLRKLKALKPLTAALRLTAAHITGILKKYPARANSVNFVRSRKFKTEKQRKYFFYALRKGLIEVPYRRGQSPGSRNLKQQWQITKETPLRVVISNATPYAHWVQRAKDQTFFHRNTGWPTDEDAVREAKPIFEQEVKRGIDAVLAGGDTEDAPI